VKVGDMVKYIKPYKAHNKIGILIKEEFLTSRIQNKIFTVFWTGDSKELRVQSSIWDYDLEVISESNIDERHYRNV